MMINKLGLIISLISILKRVGYLFNLLFFLSFAIPQLYADNTAVNAPLSHPDQESFVQQDLRAPVQVEVAAYASNANSEKGIFATDFIVPLYYPQDKNTLIFYNPKYTYTDPQANETNQGLGIRHIFDDSFILGVNAFFDRRQSDSGNWFSQAGMGLEYLSHPLDMRVNWYKPTTGYKDVGESTYGFGSTSLIEYANREEPMQGEDFEIGFPVLDKYTNTRLYLGGYFYQSQVAADMDGFRARTETHITRWLSIDTVFNSNINNRTEIYGGLRVSIPFDLADLFSKKSRKKLSASVPPSANTYLQDRIFERVVRDIDVQTKTTTTQSNAQGLVYVNDANTGVQNGTLKNPYASIPAAISAASVSGKWVFVEEGNASYVGNFTLPSGVTLWGSGYSAGFNGLHVSGIYPVIDGGATGNVITLGSKDTVMGLKVQNSGTSGNDAGVYASNVSNEVIVNNNITGNNNGIYIESNNANISGFNISDNTINTNSNDGLYINNQTSGSGSYIASGFIVSGNVFNSNGQNGIELDDTLCTSSALFGHNFILQQEAFRLN